MTAPTPPPGKLTLALLIMVALAVLIIAILTVTAMLSGAPALRAPLHRKRVEILPHVAGLVDFHPLFAVRST